MGWLTDGRTDGRLGKCANKRLVEEFVPESCWKKMEKKNACRGVPCETQRNKSTRGLRKQRLLTVQYSRLPVSQSKESERELSVVS